MKDWDKYFREQDEIEANKREIERLSYISEARLIGKGTVVRRRPNGLTTVESIESFLTKHPGRI